MRKAGYITALALDAVEKEVKPGVTTKHLDEVAHKIIVENGATPSFKGYGGFPATVCASPNNVLVHGFPNGNKLQEGDIISIDCGACYQGYHGDSARTFAVGKVSDEAMRLMEVTKNALYHGLSFVKPGNHLGDVCHAIGSYVESHGYSVPRDYTGHGVGSKLHEDPVIPNYGIAGTGPILKVGMTLAIEPMVFAGKRETKTLKDGWTVVSRDGSLAAHFEHSVVITNEGFEILTTTQGKEDN